MAQACANWHASSMKIGVPRETKTREYRVGMTPAGVRQLVTGGHEVWVEAGAGDGSGITNQQYVDAGARIVPTAADAWSAEMVVKVKEPLAAEFQYLREGLVLYTYLHLAAEAALTHELVKNKVLAIAYETIRTADGRLPLLRPVILVALVFRSLDAFRVFDLTYVLTGGGPGTATEPIALLTFSTLVQNLRFGLGSASSVVIFGVCFTLALFYIRLLRPNQEPP
jgi:alanine dehydrogenase